MVREASKTSGQAVREEVEASRESVEIRGKYRGIFRLFGLFILVHVGFRSIGIQQSFKLFFQPPILGLCRSDRGSCLALKGDFRLPVTVD